MESGNPERRGTRARPQFSSPRASLVSPRASPPLEDGGGGSQPVSHFPVRRGRLRIAADVEIPQNFYRLGAADPADGQKGRRW